MLQASAAIDEISVRELRSQPRTPWGHFITLDPGFRVPMPTTKLHTHPSGFTLQQGNVEKLQSKTIPQMIDTPIWRHNFTIAAARMNDG